MKISPAPCRGARGLAGLMQDDLAKKSKVSKRTIAQFETGDGRPISATFATVPRFLEPGRIEFAPGGARLGEQLVEAAP